jgi:invasion protein IalB
LIQPRRLVAWNSLTSVSLLSSTASPAWKLCAAAAEVPAPPTLNNGEWTVNLHVYQDDTDECEISEVVVMPPEQAVALSEMITHAAGHAAENNGGESQ